MEKHQDSLYGETISKWRAMVDEHGKGWDEDGPEIPVDYELDVEMADYYLGGRFCVSDGKELYHFTTPQCDILARVRKVKAHMNRMISSMEFARDELGRETDVDAWDFVKLATEKLRDAHHGTKFKTMIRSRITSRLKAHCTGIPSTLPWDIGFGYEILATNDNPPLSDSDEPSKRYFFELKTTVFTVCPFVLYETGGKQSHTQRTHIHVYLETTAPVQFAAIMREISTRLVPVMSNMKIPDEVVQVLKSYAGPTFTEDGAVRVVKILRGVTAEFCPDGDVITCKVKAVSEDSHLAHDVVTSLENDLA